MSTITKPEDLVTAEEAKTYRALYNGKGVSWVVTWLLKSQVNSSLRAGDMLGGAIHDALLALPVRISVRR